MTNDFIFNEYKARQFWERREYGHALAFAERAATAASEKGDDAGWWRMRFLFGECQRELGLIDDCAATAENLASHPLAGSDAVLKGKARALQSLALQGLGQLPEALAVARAAVDSPFDPEHGASAKLEAQQVLVAVLAESGNLEDAWREAEKLATLIDEESGSERAGKAYWSIGNAAFLVGKPTEATYYHGLASAALSRINDVSLWALFNKASAFMRLTANLVEPETLQCIERAEMAISITGGTKQDEIELGITRAYWMYLTGECSEARAHMAVLMQEAELMAPHIEGEARLLYARILRDEGQPEEAAKYAAESARLFENAGASARAEQSRGFLEDAREVS
ncbi:hypothetical protein [Arthrobacter caoxuetaonis]|uniref:Tetratricopeptide repeat-containing protein n=2 Tax=Arthrobacter caoxuetaonis TaxID=2886935 RepID=A0A9X1SBF6_9MICC|nr:hypothetical protein [Arthrobacter caoxuetaonis]MCC3297208.1 hypothetical protein [Arthrobacter caoxuetaonis]USQ58235.1 hypothetical protein NF551_05200 [Arthrobacter caoxuetaonis]